MFSKIWLVNLLLILCAAFFGIKAYGVWSGDMRPALETKSGHIRKDPARSKGVKPIPAKKVPPEAAYNVVVGKNLFASERKEIKPEETKPKSKVKAPQAPKENPLEEKKIEASLKAIIVYGVVISDDYQGALVTDVKKTPAPAKGRSPRRMPGGRSRGAKRPSSQVRDAKGVKWVQIGDELGDFEVAEIMKDRIVLKRGSKSYDRFVYDKDTPKARKAAVVQSRPTVISTSSAARVGINKRPSKSTSSARTVKNPATPRSREANRRAALEKLRRLQANKK